MTNGEKIKEIFPSTDSRLDERTGIMLVKWVDGATKCFKADWWNAEYKEPTTKNDLGVDSVSRKAVLKIYDEWFATCDIADKKESPKAKIKALPSVTPQEPRWIPVSERLPEERLGVLVWCPTRKNIYCACYEEKQWWIFGAYWEKVTEEIVAWRPLPTNPYSEVEE